MNKGKKLNDTARFARKNCLFFLVFLITFPACARGAGNTRNTDSGNVQQKSLLIIAS